MRSSPDTNTDQLRLLVEAQTDYAMFLLDIEGRVMTWNAGAVRINGYEAEEILGEHFSRFYTAEDRERDHPSEELRIARAEGRYEEEGWRLRKDGSRFWANVIITALYGDDGELTGFGKVTRDLTSRRLAEEGLRGTAESLAAANAELEQFRLLVASVRDYAVFMLDPGGHIRTWNAGAQRIKGYEPHEIIGRHFSAFYSREDRERGHPEHELEVAERDGRFEEEGWRVRKDGTTFWANVVITAVRDDDGDLVGFAKVTRDLTERREAQLRLEATAAELARSNAELEQFASIAAHDLVEPLHTMSGMADLLSRHYGDRLDGDALIFLEEIVKGAGRMRDLVDGLLDFARAAQGEMRLQTVLLGTVIEEVLASLRARIQESGASVRYDADGLPAVKADPDLVRSILQNLVGNALKFLSGRAPEIDITAEPEGDLWRVTVADNGIGIAEADQARIFDLFHRVDPAGTSPGAGMGLALTQRLVDRHGGRIGVDSTPGQGSRFWFTLPTAVSQVS